MYYLQFRKAYSSRKGALLTNAHGSVLIASETREEHIDLRCKLHTTHQQGRHVFATTDLTHVHVTSTRSLMLTAADVICGSPLLSRCTFLFSCSICVFVSELEIDKSAGTENLPWRTLAPESFEGVFSTKSDIWMYGAC